MRKLGQEVFSLVGHAQGDDIISASCAALFLSDDVQVGSVAASFFSASGMVQRSELDVFVSFLCATSPIICSRNTKVIMRQK